jgi:hypothetical protein
MIEIPDQDGVLEVFTIVKCCLCGRYLEKKSRKFVPKPDRGVVISHTYCDDCIKKAIEEVNLYVEGVI